MLCMDMDSLLLPLVHLPCQYSVAGSPYAAFEHLQEL
jgi:hypothetical protein